MREPSLPARMDWRQGANERGPPQRLRADGGEKRFSGSFRVPHATPTVSVYPLKCFGEGGEEKSAEKRKEFSAGFAYEAEKPVAFIKNSVFLWSTRIVSQLPLDKKGCGNREIG